MDKETDVRIKPYKIKYSGTPEDYDKFVRLCIQARRLASYLEKMRRNYYQVVDQ